jgi:hypothetical protein
MGLPAETNPSLFADRLRRSKDLWFVVPGEFISFFEDFPIAEEDGNPSGESPDLEQMAAAAVRYGVTILGPPPGGNS